jgi:cysteine desulfurase / selenocysteine lyase
MTVNLARVRQDTPGAANVLHFNNAGAALMPVPVTRALLDHIELEAEIGGYEAAERQHAKLEHTYASIASLLNCAPDEIAIVENATRAWDMAFYGFKFAEGDRILTAVAEYASNYLSYLQIAKRTGCKIEAVPNDETVQLSLDALERMMDERVKLISVTHVPTNGGLVNPAAGVGRIARAWGVPYILDACQSVGQMPLDVEAIGCDVLSGTARKYLRGPRGIGFLYVRRALVARLEPPMIDLHAANWIAADRYELRADAGRFENWECNFAGKIGLGVATDYALAIGLDDIYARVRGLSTMLRERLADIPGVVVRDIGAERCGIATFTVEGRDPAAIKQALAAKRINVTTSTAFSARLDMEARGLESIVRASVHYYNSEEEVERFAREIRSIAA